MKHIQTKNDGFYEIKPHVIAVIGVLGLLNIESDFNRSTFYFSHVCGVVLLFAAYKIVGWRRAYRRQMKLF